MADHINIPADLADQMRGVAEDVASNARHRLGTRTAQIEQADIDAAKSEYQETIDALEQEIADQEANLTHYREKAGKPIEVFEQEYIDSMQVRRNNQVAEVERYQKRLDKMIANNDEADGMDIEYLQEDINYAQSRLKQYDDILNDPSEIRSHAQDVKIHNEENLKYAEEDLASSIRQLERNHKRMELYDKVPELVDHWKQKVYQPPASNGGLPSLTISIPDQLADHIRKNGLSFAKGGIVTLNPAAYA
jgi:DNA repair exonuclease SbcCD ATPase subunit